MNQTACWWWVVYDVKTKEINSLFGDALEQRARTRLSECQALSKADHRTLSKPYLGAPLLYGGREFALGRMSLPYPLQPAVRGLYEGVLIAP